MNPTRAYLQEHGCARFFLDLKKKFDEFVEFEKFEK